jgi:hypothetical protein
MNSLKILAAAALVAVAAPAFASDTPSRSVDAHALEFVRQSQPGRLIEGRNSDRTIIPSSNARAAFSQGFAPIDTIAAQRGVNN